MSRCVATNNYIYIYDHLKREKSLITYIGASSCRFYGRAFRRRNRAYKCDRECVNANEEDRGETGKKKSSLYPSPLYYLQSFSPFTERRSASAGPIFRRPHLSRLVAGKIRQWPATSRRVASKLREHIAERVLPESR